MGRLTYFYAKIGLKYRGGNTMRCLYDILTIDIFSLQLTLCEIELSNDGAFCCVTTLNVENNLVYSFFD